MHNIDHQTQHHPGGEIQQESVFTSVGEERLHMRRIYSKSTGPAIWMVHGSIEDGRIFYTKKGKGLAPFLAAHGYDVFVADLRGRGKSSPAIHKDSRWGLSENLQEDFPAYLEKIREIKGEYPRHWMAHSWGGVLQLAFLARYQSLVSNMGTTGLPATLTFFGTKRRINTFSLSKLFKVDLVWNHFSKFLVRKYGYLPGKKFGIGSDSESRLSHSETHQWVVEKDWRDWRDGFDYRQALQNTRLPPLLSITGAADKVLGHPQDVKALVKEAGADSARVEVIGKTEGFKHDYDHISLLTHPDAPKDHFQLVLDWIC